LEHLYLLYSFFFHHSWQVVDSIKQLEQKLKASPSQVNWGLLTELAIKYVHFGDDAAALHYFKRSAETAPNDVDVQLNNAAQAMEKTDPVGAIQTYRHVFKLLQEEEMSREASYNEQVAAANHRRASFRLGQLLLAPPDEYQVYGSGYEFLKAGGDGTTSIQEVHDLLVSTLDYSGVKITREAQEHRQSNINALVLLASQKRVQARTSRRYCTSC
jgi:hypothetical protein